MLKYSGIFLVLLCVFEYGTGLYFHIAETERKCFIEEIPDETTVIVNYKVELYDPRSGGFAPSSPGMGMHVEVRDPDEKMILSRLYSSEGKISFTSHMPGEHIICLYSNSSSWFSGTQLRVHLDIQVGENTIDYSNTAQKEKFSDLQLRIRQLLDQVEQITKEQNYQRYREERFRQTSDSTHRRVFWWSLVQSVVLLIMGAWQMRHLKSFFEAKKLILRSGTRLAVTRESTNLHQISLIRSEKLKGDQRELICVRTNTNLCESPEENKEDENKKLLGKLEGKIRVIFTCRKCSYRSSKIISKQAYEQGVVVIRCDGCKNNHLIADNLGWFEELKKKNNIEKILAAKGETVRKVGSDTEGFLEIVKNAEAELEQHNENRKQRLIEEESEVLNKKVGSKEET